MLPKAKKDSGPDVKVFFNTLYTVEKYPHLEKVVLFCIYGRRSLGNAFLGKHCAIFHLFFYLIFFILLESIHLKARIPLKH